MDDESSVPAGAGNSGFSRPHGPLLLLWEALPNPNKHNEQITCSGRCFQYDMSSNTESDRMGDKHDKRFWASRKRW